MNTKTLCRVAALALCGLLAVGTLGSSARAEIPAAASSAVGGDSDAAAREKHGYWWYEKQPDPDEAPKDKPEHPDMAPPPSDSQLVAMHPKDLEKLMDDYRDYALWKMTPEHVSWYYRLQDFARRRSQAFMNVTEVVMLQNAGMNMNAEYPDTTPGLNAHATRMRNDINALLQAKAQDAAIIMLSREGCEYCKVQHNTLVYFQQQHPGWTVREVDIAQHPEIKEQFSVEYTPTTVVIFKGDSKRWFPVAVGVTSVTGVEEGIYRAIRMLQGDTDPATFTMQEYERGGVLDPEKGQR